MANVQILKAVYNKGREGNEVNPNLENHRTKPKQRTIELNELQHRLLENCEAEHLHLAQELHDGPLQDLHSIMFQLAALEEALTDEANLGQMAAAQATLQKVIQTLRDMCGDLRPPALVPFGLEKAIRSYAETFQKTYPPLNIELVLMPDNQLLSPQMRLALFRIYRELLNNVRWHAEASHVLVRFEIDSKQVVLEVKDNGCGFQPPEQLIELARHNHLGLVGVTERVEAMNGEMKVISTPGQGTLVRVRVPYLLAQEPIRPEIKLQNEEAKWQPSVLY